MGTGQTQKPIETLVSPMSLKILSINVRGLGTCAKCSLVLHELARLHYDLFLLQETHVSCKKQADHLARIWPGECFWSFGRGKSAGVALFVSPRFSGKISRFLFDSAGRVFSALVILASRSFNVVSVYAPNTVSDRKPFFENLHNYFISQGDLIVAGDFNCVDNVLDRLHFVDSSLPDKKHLHALLSDFSLIDFWRKKKPRGTSFTWSNADYSQGSRLVVRISILTFL